LDLYSSGKMHTFLRAVVFETLRTLGEEPSDYARYQFTCVDAKEDAVVSGLVIVCDSSNIQGLSCLVNKV